MEYTVEDLPIETLAIQFFCPPQVGVHHTENVAVLVIVATIGAMKELMDTVIICISVIVIQMLSVLPMTTIFGVVSVLSQYKTQKCRTPNGLFGAMAAVARRQFCAKLHVIIPQQVQ
jgi:hypothetical protein